MPNPEVTLPHFVSLRSRTRPLPSLCCSDLDTKGMDAFLLSQLIGPSTPADISDFVDEHRPSDNSKGSARFFIVKANEETVLPDAEEPFRSRFNAFKGEAWGYEQEMVAQCQIIADNAPVRGNKSVGLLSQKALREMEHAKFKYHIHALASKHGINGGAWIAFLNGKLAWLFSLFPPLILTASLQLKTSTALGPVLSKRSLSRTAVSLQLVRLMRSPFTISIFLEDMTDVVKVETVFRIAVEQCGFTILGITSKHPSGIAVSTYSRTSFMTTAESSAAKEQYKLNGPAASISPLSGPSREPEIAWEFTYNPTTSNAQPKLASGSRPSTEARPNTRKGKKRAAETDSDDEEDYEAAPARAVGLATPSRPARKCVQRARDMLEQAAVEERQRAARERAAKAARLVAEAAAEAEADDGDDLDSEEEEEVKKQVKEEEESPTKLATGRSRSRKKVEEDEESEPDREYLAGRKRIKSE
ncbi:hypothetical protein JCM11251_003800 [Rhodosporidiobolus azoricus]